MFNNLLQKARSLTDMQASGPSKRRSSQAVHLLNGLDPTQVAFDKELMTPPPKPSLDHSHNHHLTVPPNRRTTSLNGGRDSHENGSGALFSLEDDTDDHHSATGSTNCKPQLVPPAAHQGNTLELQIQGAKELFSITELEEKLTRLRKFEAAYPELARSYQDLARKCNQVEQIIRATTPLANGIQTNHDLEDFLEHQTYTKAKLENASNETARLKRSMSELQELKDLESTAKIEIFTTMQQKIAEKDEEIAKLKATVHGVEPAKPDGGDSPPKADNISVLKQKMQELAAALKKVTDQRNKAVERCKELNDQLEVAKNQVRDKQVDDSKYLVPVGIVSRLQVDLETLRQKLKDETTHADSLSHDVLSLRRSVTQLVDINRKLRAGESVDESSFETQSDVNGDIEKLLLQLRTAEDKISLLEETVASLNNPELDTYEKKLIRDLEVQLKSVKSECAVASESANKWKSLYEECQSAANHSSGLHERLQEAEQHRIDLESQLTKEKTVAAELLSQIIKLQTKIEHLELSLASSNLTDDENARLKMEVDFLSKRVEAIQKSEALLTSKLSSAEADVATLNELREQHTHQSINLSEYSKLAEALRSELAQQKLQIDELNFTLRTEEISKLESHSRATKLEEALKATEAVFAGAQSELQMLGAEMKSLQTALDLSRTSHASEKAKFESISKENEELKSLVDELQTAKDELQRRTEALDAEIAKVTRVLRQTEQEQIKVQTDFTAVLAELETMKRTLDETKSHLTQKMSGIVTASLMDVEAQYSAEREELKGQLLAERFESEKFKVELETELANTREQLAASQNEMQVLADQVETLEQSLKSHMQNLGDKDRDLKQKTLDLESLQQCFEEMSLLNYGMSEKLKLLESSLENSTEARQTAELKLLQQTELAGKLQKMCDTLKEEAETLSFKYSALELSSLESEAKSRLLLSQKESDFENELAEGKRQLQEKESELAQVIASRDEALTSKEAAEAAVADISITLQQAESRMLKLKDTLSQCEEELSRKSDELIQKLLEHSKVVDGLKGQLKSAQDHQTDLKSQLAEQQSNTQQLSTQRDDLAHQLESATATARREEELLRQQLRDSQQALESEREARKALNGRDELLENAEKRIKSLQTELTKLRTEFSHTKGEFAEAVEQRDKVLSDKIAEVKKLELDLSQLSAIKEDDRIVIVVLESKLAALQAELSTSLKEGKDHLAQKLEALESLRVHALELESANESKSRQLKDLERAMAEQTNKISDAEGMISTLNTKLKELSDESNDSKLHHEKDTAALQARISDLEQAKAKAISDATELAKAVGELRSQLTNAQESLNQHTDSVVSKDMLLESIKSERDQAIAKITSLQADITTTRYMYNGERQAVNELRRRLTFMLSRQESIFNELSTQTEIAAVSKLQAELHVRKLEEESEQLIKEKASLGKQLSDSCVMVEKLTKDNSHLKILIDEKQEAIRNISANLKVSEEKYSTEMKLAETVTEQLNVARDLDKLKEEHNAVLSSYEALKQEFSDKERAIADVQQNLISVNKELGSVKLQRESSQKEVAAASESIKEIKSQLAKELAAKADLEAKLSTLQQKAKVAQDQNQKELADFGELRSKYSQLERELSESQMIQAEVDALTKKLKAQEGVMADLERSVKEADASKLELVKQLESKASLLNAIQAEFKTTQEDTTALQTKLEEAVSRAMSAEESLALAKQSAHELDDSVSNLEMQVATLKKQLSDEEEKKSKSIQLLRNSKARILKLEETVKLKESQLESLSDQLTQIREHSQLATSERTMEVSKLKEQIVEMSAKIRTQQDELLMYSDQLKRRELEQHGRNDQVVDLTNQLRVIKAEMEELEQQKVEKDVEFESLTLKCQDLTLQLSRAVSDRDSIREALKLVGEKKRVEAETSKTLLTQQASQLSMWPARVSELESRISTIDAELETSKGLFQSKSIEADALKLRVSELERTIYEHEQVIHDHNEQVLEIKMELDMKKFELEQLQRQHASIVAEHEKLKDAHKMCEESIESEKARIVAANDKIKGLEEREANLQKAIVECKKTIEGKDAEIMQAQNDLARNLAAFDKASEEGRAKELHLQKLNKALKEEVRKLSRGNSPPTSNTPTTGPTTPTLSHRSSAPNLLESSNQETSRTSTGSSNSNATTIGQLPNRTSSHVPASQTTRTTVAAVEPNMEYMRNVFVKFVESRKEQKALMVPALAMIFQLSTEELKRVQRSL